MKKIDIEKGSKRADARFRITVEETGPYLIYGQPPLAKQFIMARRRGRKLVLSAGCALPDRRRTDGAVPLRRLEEQALLRRSTRPRGVGSAPDGRRRSAAGQR